LKKSNCRDFLIGRPFAHRGLHDSGQHFGEVVPENSIKSFELAIKNGFSIEMDLQVTEDLEIVVFHDDYLQRLTQKEGLITKCTLDHLKSAKLANEESIPSLSEVLDYVNGKVPVLIEIKESKKLKDNLSNFLGKLTKKIVEYKGQVGLMSFDIDILTSLKAINFQRKIPLGLTTDFPSIENKQEKYENNKIETKIQKLDLDFVSQNWKGIKNKRILDIRNSGLIIICWTVTSKKIEELVKQETDNITFEGYKPF